MRLVAVSIVKNEADIIEPFVRHTSAWVDHHLIFDHDSTDGTREILGQLQREGIALTLFTDDALANLQQSRSNYLTRRAAQAHHADWILPLDADEILVGLNREHLERDLSNLRADLPACLPLLDYCSTTSDDATEVNPLLRLRYCQANFSPTKKLMVPRSLALDAAVIAGKGSHALHRGTEILPAQPLPVTYHLAHLALRSASHQALRVSLAELQKLSRGSAHAGLDVHYRLGFQLLADNPDLFRAAAYQPASSVRLQPIDYQAGALRYTQTGDWQRVVRALLPYLEKLALSHGQLVDVVQSTSPSLAGDPPIREIDVADLPFPVTAHPAPSFAGFVAKEGWGPREGPVPEAFLPPFHWAYAPQMRLMINSPGAGPGFLRAEVLTYSENQSIEIALNGTPVSRLDFSRINQKERIATSLLFQAGENELTFHFSQALVTAHDSRRLAAIFLSLVVVAPIAP